MDRHEQTDSGGDGNGQAFASRLQTLKQEGCSLLVVGTAPDAVYRDTCRQMLGDSEVSTRRRLFVAIDQEVSVARDLVSAGVQRPSPATAKILSFDGSTRSATTQTPQETSVPVTEVDGSDLADLGIAISECIAEFDSQEAGLSPAELRVCVDSLTPLLDHGREPVFRFLDLLNARIRRVGGMGHMHLHAERDSEITHLLTPLFDAVVELRLRDDNPEQRWYLTDAGLTSGWFTQDDE